MSQTRQNTPAIVRDVCDADTPTSTTLFGSLPQKIINEPNNTVTSRRGIGDSGYRVQTVKHDCPVCDFDRMIRRIDVHPEFRDEVRYWCLNPNCVHFVSDELSHDCHGSYPQNTTQEPAVFELDDD